MLLGWEIKDAMMGWNVKEIHAFRILVGQPANYYH
jgi:hypothetical protein